jgi:hypothetical protein
MQLRPPDVDLVFRPGVRYRWSSGSEAVVEVLDAGTLHLPTGELVVMDPFLGPDVERFAVPLTVTAPPGRYAVSLSVARWDRRRDPNTPAPVGAVAAAKLTIRDEPVVAWELGLQPGQAPATLQPDELFGFAVAAARVPFLTRQPLRPSTLWVTSARTRTFTRTRNCSRSCRSFEGSMSSIWSWSPPRA